MHRKRAFRVFLSGIATVGFLTAPTPADDTRFSQECFAISFWLDPPAEKKHWRTSRSSAWKGGFVSSRSEREACAENERRRSCQQQVSRVST